MDPRGFAGDRRHALAGCSVGPDYQTPATLVPGEYLPPAGENAAQLTTAATADLTQWWRILDDRELDSLVARARDSNLDLAVALDRLQEARTLVTVAVSQALPVVGATGGGGVGTGSDETKGRVPQALRSAENAENLNSVNEAGGLDASWELDLLGKFRREVEAQTADAEEALRTRTTGRSWRSPLMSHGPISTCALSRDSWSSSVKILLPRAATLISRKGASTAD